MASRVRRLLLVAGLLWAVVAGAGSSELIRQWRALGVADDVAATAAVTGFDVMVVPTPAGGVLTALAGRGPALTAEPGAFAPAPIATLAGLAVALLLLVPVDIPATVRGGLVRRRGPPRLLLTSA
jgi:hypothetical protein